MPTSGEVLDQINNTQAFVDATTEHAQGLVRDGIVWNDPIPVFLRPYTQVSRGYPEDTIVRFDYINGVGTGGAVDENDRATYGDRSIFGVELLEGLHIAGRSMTVTPKELRRAMAQDTLREIIKQPFEEWARTCQELTMDIATSGMFSDGSGDPTDNLAGTVDGLQGPAQTLRLPTNTAETCTARIANDDQLVTFANRSGGTFAAAHDHTVDDAGAWTRAVGRSMRDLVTEHPGQGNADAFVGSTVGGVVLDELEQQHGGSAATQATIPAATQFAKTGRIVTDADFGLPVPLGQLDNGLYWQVDDLGALSAVYIARGTQPFRAFVGARGRDGGLDTPFSWTEKLHRELRGSRDNAGVEYGYRGYFDIGVQNPVGVAVGKMEAA